MFTKSCGPSFCWGFRNPRSWAAGVTSSIFNFAVYFTLGWILSKVIRCKQTDLPAEKVGEEVVRTGPHEDRWNHMMQFHGNFYFSFVSFGLGCWVIYNDHNKNVETEKELRRQKPSWLSFRSQGTVCSVSFSLFPHTHTHTRRARAHAAQRGSTRTGQGWAHPIWSVARSFIRPMLSPIDFSLNNEKAYPKIFSIWAPT